MPVELMSYQPCDNFPISLGVSWTNKGKGKHKSADRFMTCSLYYISLIWELRSIHTKERMSGMKKIYRENAMRISDLLRNINISTMDELLSMSVVELIEGIGEENTDLVLKKLLRRFVGLTSSYIELINAHQYVLDIFEANDFNDNLDWFYKITIEEFINLEDLSEAKIPFLTYYHKYFVNEREMIEPEHFSYYDDVSDSYIFYINPEVVR